MNSVERVKNICKSRKIPIYRLEKDLGYANGYIGQLRKGSFPDNRLVEIAAYLSVPVSELTGEVEEKEKPVTKEGDELDAETIQLKEIWDTADHEEREALLAMAKMLKARRNK